MLYYVDSRVPETHPLWQAYTSYSVGDFVRFSWATEVMFVCRQAGTSGASEPAFQSVLNGSWITRSDNGVEWEGCWGSEEFGWTTACALSYLMSVSSSHTTGSPRVGFIPSRGRADFLIAKGQGPVVVENTYAKYEDLSSVFVGTPLWPELFTNAAFISVTPSGQFGWSRSGHVEVRSNEFFVRGPEIYDHVDYRVKQTGVVFGFPTSGITSTNAVKLVSPVFTDSKITFDNSDDLGSALYLGNPSLDASLQGETPSNGVDLSRIQIRRCEVRYTNRFNALIVRADTVIESTDFLPHPKHPRFAIGFNDQFMDGRAGVWGDLNVFSLNLPVSTRNERVVLVLRGCDFSALTGVEFLFAPARSHPVEILAEGCIWPDGVDLWESAPGMTTGTWSLTAMDCRRAGESFLAGQFSQHTDCYDLVKIDGVYRVGGYVDQYQTNSCWHIKTNEYLEPFYDMATLPAIDCNVTTPGRYMVHLYFLADKDDLTYDDVELSVLGPSTTEPGLVNPQQNLTGYETTRKINPHMEQEVVPFSAVPWSGVGVGYTKYELKLPVHVSHSGRVRVILSLGRPKTEFFVCPEPALLEGLTTT